MTAVGESIDDLIGVPTVVDPDPYKDLDLEGLLEDLARGIFTVDEILPRYGLDRASARTLLLRPAVYKRLEEKKKHWNSDANAAERLKTYYQLGLIEAAPELLSSLADKTIPFRERVEAHKFVAKIAGLEPDARTLSSGGTSGPGFSVNIVFSNGHQQTITAAPAPPPAVEAEVA